MFQMRQRGFSAEALPALCHPGKAEHRTPLYVTGWNPGTVELCGEAWRAMELDRAQGN